LLREIKPAQPTMDTSETATSYEVVLDLPGFDKKEIKVTIAHHRLTIIASHSHEKKHADAHYLTRERSNGEFMRSIGKRRVTILIL
jgi:HSP20 family protein